MSREESKLAREKLIERVFQKLDRIISKANRLLSVYPEEARTAENDRREEFAKVRETFGEFFQSIEGNPCPTCLNTCCGRGYMAGYFEVDGTDLHPDFIERKANFRDFVSDSLPEDFDPKSSLHDGEYCVFLNHESGCTLPYKYRSTVCTRGLCTPFKKQIEGKWQTNKEDLKRKKRLEVLSDQVVRDRLFAWSVDDIDAREKEGPLNPADRLYKIRLLQTFSEDQAKRNNRRAKQLNKMFKNSTEENSGSSQA